MTPTFDEQVDQIIANRHWGKPTAAKRGRRPEWPYVPVIDLSGPPARPQRTEQILGKAFATRAEAIDHAAKVIEARKQRLRLDLSDPRYRALREKHGLPRELPASPQSARSSRADRAPRAACSSEAVRGVPHGAVAGAPS